MNISKYMYVKKKKSISQNPGEYHQNYLHGDTPLVSEKYVLDESPLYTELNSVRVPTPFSVFNQIRCLYM